MTPKEEQYRNEDGRVIIYFVREDEVAAGRRIDRKKKGTAPGHYYAPIKNTDAMVRIDEDAVIFLIREEELIPESEWQKTIKAQKTADAHAAEDRDPDNW